jgi:hypothetical protein
MRDALERIADALERIADALAPQEAQETPQDVQDGPTLTNPLLAWFVAQETVQDVQEAPLAFADLEPSTKNIIVQRGKKPSVIVQRGRPKNRVSHCGRCGREDTRRMNHSDSCAQCVNEAWWSE